MELKTFIINTPSVRLRRTATPFLQKGNKKRKPRHCIYYRQNATPFKKGEFKDKYPDQTVEEKRGQI